MQIGNVANDPVLTILILPASISEQGLGNSPFQGFPYNLRLKNQRHLFISISESAAIFWYTPLTQLLSVHY